MAFAPTYKEPQFINPPGASRRSRSSLDEGYLRTSSNTAGLEEADRAEDDYEELKRAALDGLSTKRRLRTAVLPIDESGEEQTVNVKRLGRAQRAQLVSKALETDDQENEVVLRKIQERMQRVGIEPPQVEVRFEGLTVEADVVVGARGLPSVGNSFRATADRLLGMFGVRGSQKRVFTILKDVTGILKPGRMVLLLGPPGGGKTTLLNALAGKLRSGGGLRMHGDITYNGSGLHEFVPQRTASYVSQVDDHIGEMTVRETFDFSARCQGVANKAEMLMSLLRKEREMGITPDPAVDAYLKASAVAGGRESVVTDYMLKLLGLDVCADTVVGNAMIRGISGGQKRRVTSGEMIVGPKRVVFMDEISTGLDSSTTFQIVKCTRNFSHMMKGTVLMALLQPPPEVYELFDDIMLLSEGCVIYMGPRTGVVPFFESMGFRCPERKAVPDFLQEVNSIKDQAQYWVKEGPHNYVPVAAFVEQFRRSPPGKALAEALATPFDKASAHPQALMTKRYSLPGYKVLLATLEREWLLMRRNSFLYIFRTCQAVVLAFILSTLFIRSRLHPDNINDGTYYLGALFFSQIHMLFTAFSEQTLTVQRLPVFYKQRDNLFYPVWAFVLPVTLLRLPYSLLEAVVWSIIVYWSVGFAPDAGRFFWFMFILFLVHQMAVSLFRLIGSIGRSMVVTNTLGSFSLLIVFVLGGFIIAKRDIHPWWIWAYWISPLSYAQSALAVNEFLAPRWQIATPLAGGVPLGQVVLQQRSLPTEGYWVWLGAVALIGYTVLFNLLVVVAQTKLNPLGHGQRAMPEDAFKPAELQASMHDSVASQAKGGKARATELAARKPTSNGANGRSAAAAGVTAKDGGEGLEEEGAPGARLEGSKGAGRGRARGMVLPFQPLALTFHHVNYYVDMPQGVAAKTKEKRLQLLRDCSGSFRPGVLTALVGVSGAGKTTLMDVLAGRKTGGYIDGDIRISGHPKDQRTFARISGYVEQTDVHAPQTNVHEALLFSALLRLGEDVSAEQRERFVEEVLELVELAPLRNALVGLPGVSGLSVEQRKRLTIAVELVANPSIIFLDEPTSGLDARAAAIVMRSVRAAVDTGRTVVATIHQPSIDIFESFDDLLLMKRGGYVIYCGPLGTNSQCLVDYFEALPGVPKLREGVNPATWMLEISTPAAEQRLNLDFAEAYRNSKLYRRIEEQIAELSSPAEGSQPLRFDTVYARSKLAQFRVCLWRNNITWWRSPAYNFTRLLFTTLIGIIFGTVFWDRGHSMSTRQDVFNIAGAMYAAVLFLGVSNSSTVQSIMSVERGVSYRERAAGCYSVLPFSLALVVIELPYVFVQTCIYSVLTYSMIQFVWTPAKFWLYFVYMYETLLYFTFFGMASVCVCPSLDLAAVLSSNFYATANLFAGFLIPLPQAPPWWAWVFYIDPVQWTLYGLVGSQLSDVTSQLTLEDGTHQLVRDFLFQYFWYRHDFLGEVVAILAGFVVVFALGIAFALRLLNYQRR